MRKFFTSLRTIWQKIDTCPAWNYYKAIEVDSRYLIRGIDYEKLPDVTKAYQSKLDICLFELNMEAAQYEIDTIKRNQIVFDLTKKVEVMQAEYHYVIALLNYIQVKGHDKTIEDQLGAIGFGLRSDIPLMENITRLRNRNENKMIKINEKRDELKALTDSGNEKQPAIEKSLVLVEKHFGRDIDMQKISIKKWLTMKNQVLEDIKRQQKRK